MSIYIGVAGLALAVKVWVLWRYREAGWQGASWMAFVSSLALFNLSELGVYAAYSFNMPHTNLLAAYYVCCITVMSAGVFYSMDGDKFLSQKIASWLIAAFGLILSVLFVSTNLMVESYNAGVFPVEAIKGRWFPFFQFYSLASLSCMLGFLVFNYRRCSQAKVQAAYIYSMIGMFVVVAAGVSLTILMMAGVDANGSGLLPITTTVFLLLTASGRNLDLVGYDIRVLDPYSIEAKARKQLSKIHSQYSFDEISLNEAIAMTEKILINHKLDSNNGNKSETARQIKINRKTLYNKLSKN